MKPAVRPSPFSQSSNPVLPLLATETSLSIQRRSDNIARLLCQDGGAAAPPGRRRPLRHLALVRRHLRSAHLASLPGE
ncbi:hypothetical protein ANCDUO_11818 [Ancylostoma duodenale]|uniref:Uncharacterized protein n=1 Tax=Ancylostoma duodenale TaxID=51022 RepID=A0A0C2GLN9_9BILA|nr:hypothetical protein ANCDUO_11818 [Ancylostoma duodenale]